MSMGRPDDQEKIHAAVILRCAEGLAGQRWFVLADHIGWKPGAPEPVGRHVPDIVAQNPNGQWFIIEVETCWTFSDLTTTKPQLQDFDQAAAYIPYVLVPRACDMDHDVVNVMKSLFQEWRITRTKVGTWDQSLQPTYDL